MSFTEFGFQIGPVSIQWYAVIILTGAVLALYLATREAEKFGIQKEEMMDLFFLFMLAGIVGARVYYVLFSGNLDYYLANPAKIIATWEGGIAIYGGIIGATIAGLYYAKKKNWNILLIADIVFPVVMLAQSIGRWGNFVNIEAYGGPVPGQTLVEQTGYLHKFLIPDFIINRMTIQGVVYHPTFLYESVWNIVGFILIYFIIRKWSKLKLGMLTLSYFVWYGIGRLWIEGMRTDSLYLFGNIRVSQVVSLVLIVVGICGFVYLWKNKTTTTPYLDAKIEREE